MQKHADYYENINVALLDSIPPDSSLVLEIGCATGALGAAHKRRFPSCRYIGVEVHPASAMEASERLDMVLCGSVEGLDLGFLRDRVDCLVYGDVLEHLLDPWAALRSHAALLRPGGTVHACIPNVQHWSLLDHLLRGGWVYSDHGILDDTHLRFFTLNTIRALFDQAGLDIRRTVGLQTSPEQAAAFLDKIRPALGPLGVEVEAFGQTSAPLQFLVSAGPRPTAALVAA